MSSVAAAPRLSPAQVALLPNHDPMVGRAVGQIFKAQQFNEKPEKVTLSGQIDGKERVYLTYARQADGSVAVDGVVGGLEVHEKIAPAVRDSQGGGFFGVGGNVKEERVAVVTGTIGGVKEDVRFAVDRDTTQVPLTQELQAGAQSGMKWGFKVGMTPAFGGDMFTPNMTPGEYPTATAPLRFEDSYFVGGKVGDVEVSRHVQWNTTSWTVTSNSREGWGWSEFFQTSSGSAGQSIANKQEGLSLQTTPFTVEKNVVTASGFLELAKESGTREQIPFSSRYEQIPRKMALKVDEQIGEHTLSFSVFPDGDMLTRDEQPNLAIALPPGAKLEQKSL